VEDRFEVQDGQILLVREVPTPNQTVIIKTYYGAHRRVVVNPLIATISLGEQLSIEFIWQVFNLEQAGYVDDPTNDQSFKVEIAGESHEVIPVDGTATIQFSSAAAGEFEIKTVNPNVDNTSVKVVVQDATG